MKMINLGRRNRGGVSCLILIGTLPLACAKGADVDETETAALSARGRGPSHGEGGGKGGAGDSTCVGGGGAAGVADSPPKACTGTAPSSPLIASFDDATPSASVPGQFDLPSIGGTYTYASDGISMPTLSLSSRKGKARGQALGIAIATGLPPASEQFAWSGAGIYFNACTDASAYSGVRFTVKGDLGTCPLYFSTTFSDDDAIDSNPSTGSCVSSAGCYPPWFQPVKIGVNTIAFSSMTSGSPVSTVNPADLTGVHWEVRPPTALISGAAGACNASFTIDDVTFVR